MASIKPVHSTPCDLCETFVHVVVKNFYHEDHEDFTKDTRPRVYLISKIY